MAYYGIWMRGDITIRCTDNGISLNRAVAKVTFSYFIVFEKGNVCIRQIANRSRLCRPF